MISTNNNSNVLREDVRNKLFTMEILGAVFVITAAVILHFIYDWSGQATWAVLFGAVNESIWEHLKIFSLPYVFWGFIELLCIRPPFKKFVVAKAFSLYFLLFSIPIFFYTYTAILGKSVIFIDIASGLIFTILTFVISCQLMKNCAYLERYYVLALILFAIYYFMFAYFTTVPPKLPLFKDPVTGWYGIPMKL